VIKLSNSDRQAVNYSNCLYRVSISLSWNVWPLNLRKCQYSTRPSDFFDVEHKVFLTQREMQFHGIAFNYRLDIISLWIGSCLMFFQITKDNIVEMTCETEMALAEDSGLCCVDLTFNSRKNCAVSLWGQSDTNTTSANVGIHLSLYTFGDHEVSLRSTIPIKCGRGCYSFHPTKDILLVTTKDGLRLYRIDDIANPELIRTVSADTIKQSMRINYSKRDYGIASPPSTMQTLGREHNIGKQIHGRLK
jgi:hypothetical protein